MSKRLRQLAYICGDAVICAFVIYAATWLRFEGHIQPLYIEYMWLSILISVVTVLGSGLLIGSYNGLWEYIAFPDILRQLFCAGFSGAVFLVIKYSQILNGFYTDYHISGSITVIYVVMAFVATVGIRFLPRFKNWVVHNGPHKDMLRTLIIGAGSTGAMLMSSMRDNINKSGIYPVVAVDSDPAKRNMRVAGVPVGGGVEDIPRLAAKYNATDAILAIPSIARDEIPVIYAKCSEAGLRLRVFRDSVDIESYLVGNKTALREVEIEDLLFRDTIKPDMTEVYKLISGKTVVVTGGAGSIGSEICRQVLAHGCRKLIIFDIHENGLFNIDAELAESYPRENYVLCVGSVRDRQRLDDVFEKYSPDIVLHAAAHKHVPMMEMNPIEAVKNNVIGTKNVLDACICHNVGRFILISTDKAVRPTNIMGATKRMAEIIVQTMNGNGCEMAAVRFGNVLGSNGSVIPTFKRQIAEGGPITVTHKDIVRYFMTIPEAVSLVLTAGTIAHGGEVFILDMGKPVRIYDLARDLIRLSGLEPGRDIEIKITGLRPGEKLYEELVQTSESIDTTSRDKVFIAKGNKPDPLFVHDALGALMEAIESGESEEKVKSMVFETIGAFENQKQ